MVYLNKYAEDYLLPREKGCKNKFLRLNFDVQHNNREDDSVFHEEIGVIRKFHNYWFVLKIRGLCLKIESACT